MKQPHGTGAVGAGLAKYLSPLDIWAIAFGCNMSHDIRTPMNAIIGYTNLAREENRDPAMAEYLDKIDVSGRHLLDLIDDILEMSRIESGAAELEYAPMDLRALLRDTRDLFAAQAREKDLDFSVDFAQVRHPYVLGDRKSLSRVLLNIISNAFKFTPAGGAVSVSLWEIDSGESGRGTYELRIRDSGIGMSREFSEKVFTAFERERTSTDSGVQGTGLGMAITKGIMDRLGGGIALLKAPTVHGLRRGRAACLRPGEPDRPLSRKTKQPVV